MRQTASRNRSLERIWSAPSLSRNGFLLKSAGPQQVLKERQTCEQPKVRAGNLYCLGHVVPDKDRKTERDL